MTTTSASVTSNYVVLDGLSIEMTDSGNEVFFTPDIHIKKNLSMTSATSSIYGETGAPEVKHLHTFSEEEEEEDKNIADLFNFASIGLSSDSQDEEREQVEQNDFNRDMNTNQVDDVSYNEADTENDLPQGRYRRPRDSFGMKLLANNPRQTLPPQRTLSPKQTLSPTQTLSPKQALSPRTETAVIIPKDLDPRSPHVSPSQSSVVSGVKVNKILVPKDLDPRSPHVSPQSITSGTKVKSPQSLPGGTKPEASAIVAPIVTNVNEDVPRILSELSPNSPRKGKSVNAKIEKEARISVKQRVKGWESYVLSSGVIQAPVTE